jgi:hypothetical protein
VPRWASNQARACPHCRRYKELKRVFTLVSEGLDQPLPLPPAPPTVSVQLPGAAPPPPPSVMLRVEPAPAKSVTAPPVGRFLFRIDVDIGGGRDGAIDVHYGENPRDLAQTFIRREGLEATDELLQALVGTIKHR